HTRWPRDWSSDVCSSDLAGLEEGVVTPSQILDCGNGGIQIGNVEIHEHGGNRYGLMSFEDVMLRSSNVGTIRVGMSLGDDRFYRSEERRVGKECGARWVR